MSKILFILILSLSAIADTFIVQSDSSNINFSVDKFLFISVDGKFSKFKGKITIDNNMVTSIDGIVDIKSVDTDNEKRDEDLKGEGYFNVTQHQYIYFKAIAVDDKELEAAITIKGITKKIRFNIDEIKSTGTKLTLKISSVVNREDFMLNGSFSSVIANDVKVSATLQAYLQ
ncbi:periplasmic protein containing Lipid/polyisoprenoid-binding, YceI-like domain [Sulfurimonas gotlandica GD1]|jgi:polyisoprenoid-binding protein YceI|uniref:Periplasmic protein containing Lipid/polyisoprenoid-binding, YceI-like domain n=1 Tax=Sulfurimonas gotlandica (strain DSM 19862 / JCM 16533 / GD1) TaxID=929558 RepID=B6BMY4_SULGG|nr:YceI family protein [Sulfurimonas gotlandica]EDZ61657.1 YceI family protein [Sulfurimonas gotlandica GD1]EHP30742.1 periplasmic protein containing Lipid/polyisoprenoid-binding, YceI-like domain [Sulfurimonas gotlandica GD1]